jgi:hypothetical protein
VPESRNTANPADQTLVKQFDGEVASAPHYSPGMSMFTFEFDFELVREPAHDETDGSNVNVLPLANGDVCEASPCYSRARRSLCTPRPPSVPLCAGTDGVRIARQLVRGGLIHEYERAA